MNASVSATPTLTVSTSAELQEAYQTLKSGSGGTILLDGEEPFELSSFDGQNNIDAAVIIQSANPNSPATLSAIHLTGAENLTLDTVLLHMDGDPTSYNDVAIVLTNSTGITIRNSTLTSDATSALGTVDTPESAANLAIIRDSSGITFENNTVSGFNHGLTFMDSHNIDVLGNTMTALQGDGIRLAGVDGMHIEGNHLYDFLGATQAANHADMIQIWGTNTMINTQNISIRENILDTGNGANYQMIFGHNSDRAENGFVFDNITIEGNVLFGAHANSISLEDTNNTTVAHNTVIYNPDAYTVLADGSQTTSDMDTRIHISGTNTTIENNIAQVVDDQTANAVLTNTSAFEQSDYRTHFTNIEAGGSGDLRDLMLLPDSPLNGTFGSWLTWSTDTADTTTAVGTVTAAPHDRSLFTLDASLSRGPDGYLIDQGVTFTWHFADGSTASGPTLQHDFGQACQHTYDLIVTLPDGTSDQISRTLDIESPLISMIDFEGASLVTPPSLAAEIILHDDPMIEDGWLTIGGRDRLEVTRDTANLFNLNDFNIGLTVDAAPTTEGYLLQLPKTLDAKLIGTGQLEVSLTTQDGTFTLTSTSAIFADAGVHDLNFLYDGAAQTLSLMVDGQIDATTPASGTTPASSYWGLTVGATWETAADARVRDIYILNEPSTLSDAIDATPTLTPPTDTAVDLAVSAPNQSDTLIFLDFDDTEILDTSGNNVSVNQISASTAPNPTDHTENGTVTINDSFALSVDRSYQNIFQLDDFVFDFDMRSDTSDGRSVFGIHQSSRLDVINNDLSFRLTTTEGTFVLQTTGHLLEDGGWHNVQIGYSSDIGYLQIFVDGTSVASTEAVGQTLEQSYWGLEIGDRWGNSFQGEIDDFAMMTNISDQFFDFG